MASRFTIVRSPPQNGRRKGAGSAQDISNAWTSVIFTRVERGAIFSLTSLPGGDEFMHVFADQVRLQIDRVPYRPFAQVCDFVGMRDDPDPETLLAGARHRQADAV